MKKFIVILILIVYIASIAIVNFFGLEIEMFDGITYVSGIQCDEIILRSEDSKRLEPTRRRGDGTPVFEFEFKPAKDGTEYDDSDASLLSNPNAVELDYVVFPYNADDTDVGFEYDKEAMAGVAVFREDIRTLIFLKPDKAFTVTIRATDGSNVSTSIVIEGTLKQEEPRSDITE